MKMNADLKKQVLFPFHLMMHPIEGSNAIKWEDRGTYPVSAALIGLLFITLVLQRQTVGFIFNPNRLDQINIVNILAVTVTVVILWIISNRALCTLMDGEGKLSQIIIGSCYSLLPFILLTIAGILASQVLTLDMAVFLRYIEISGYLWSFLVLFQVMRVIHQFTARQTLWNLLLTVFGMLIIAFIALLIYSLFQQVYVFIFTIFNEIMFRL